ncbi:aldolase/citrate lyase family protein [Cytobacillus oceanisediminis]
MSGLFPHRVRAALADGRSAHGTWVQTDSPEACSAAAATGYDFVVIDLQHGASTMTTLTGLVTAVTRYGASPVVRLPDPSPEHVPHVLDAGAHGVIVPELRSAAQARAVVAASRHAPEGTRGACPTVAATAHGAIGWDEYLAWCRTEPTVWGLIETREAVEDIADIAASGLDALVLGPFDLAMDLGLDGDVDHPEVVAAMRSVGDAARGAGIETVAVLFETVDRVPKGAGRWVDQGCRILTASSDRWLLTQGWSAALSGLRSVPAVRHDR